MLLHITHLKINTLNLFIKYSLLILNNFVKIFFNYFLKGSKFWFFNNFAFLKYFIYCHMTNYIGSDKVFLIMIADKFFFYYLLRYFLV